MDTFIRNSMIALVIFLSTDAFPSFPFLRELEVPLNGLRGLKIQHNDFPLLEVRFLNHCLIEQAIIVTGSFCQIHFQ